ncbi:MAG: sodium:alanine symporter family protein [Bacteroidaceae bacterium]|nr:sodium:alanine symporter family protein [Bacteroidaceae bacterium]MBQ4462592.1 sodium:alanine symporter family protein [Bacteroidaceae bacterium]
MEKFESIIGDISSFLWGWPMMILLVGIHIYLTIILRFPQRKLFTGIKLSVKKDKDADGDVSQFGALATSLAATIGTGNIVGVATAIALGGPGAVLWCWLTGVFGIATKYAEGLLAIKYRVKTEHGKMLGGPMYALEKGLNSKTLAIMFAVFTSVAAFGIGNTVQANSISMLLHESYGIEAWITGAITAILVALVIIGGIKGIAKVCTAFVPFMAIMYVLGCFYILCINHAYIGQAISVIIDSAFHPQAAGGGFVGSTVMIAARYGIARGLFSNESGMGSAPIAAAAARTRNPVRQALVSSTGTFWDTVVVCAITGIMLVSSIIAFPDIDYHDGGALTKVAFSKIPYLGTPILTFGIITFAFSTILGWSYYAERTIEYLLGHKFIWSYRVLWIIAVFFGAVLNLKLVWDLADCFNALMAIPNLLSLVFLSKVLISETRKYLWEGNLEEDAPEEE